ncbi:helix-turn-helix domain-containing protein [Plantactinospora solaniradicis]|uniref:Helix-turn-helix domain-containing protein n=1 Tax=Plantactinospora solaniradicis TaxID=1723736 RepID=A0ABW1K2S7_9ACTN
MERGWHSVEQVAERLGLHVRTVRGYIRAGRLKAVRIGKQYRIAQADLDAFTGRPADAVRSRVEVSTIVEIDDIGALAADRLSTLLVAGAQLPRDTGEPLRIQTVYDEARTRFKVIILGGVATTAEVLQTIDGILETENGMFLTDPDRPAAPHG